MTFDVAVWSLFATLLAVWFAGVLVIERYYKIQFARAARPSSGLPITRPFHRLLCCFFYHEDIVKDIDGRPSLYLRRWFLLGWSPMSKNQAPKPGIYLHQFCRSDDDRDPHDHPWDFTTIVLKGGYVDETWHADHEGGRAVVGYEPCGPFSVRRRKAEHLHRVQLMPGRTSWSLLFIAPKRRSWGFHTPTGWQSWRDYFGAGASSIDEQP